MFQLSSNPTLQQTQLKELLERSAYYLALLTSPVDTRPSYQLEEQAYRLYNKQELKVDYSPPPTRYARLGNNHHTSLNFDS